MAALLLAATVLGLASPSAQAGLITTYQFNGVTVSGGGTVTGSFVFDHTLGAISSANLVTNGNLAGLNANVFDTPEAVVNWGGQLQIIIATDNTFSQHIVCAPIGLGLLGSTGSFAIQTAGPLISYIYQPNPDYYGGLTGGTVVGTTSLVPDGGWSLMLTGLGLIGLLAARRTVFARN
ncbi:MAG: hypothetical protein HZC55_02600 [Verrucomicrobia bacterium]|nr:hypothetical protein [Verrucomicrobiota bacterium]